AGPDGRREGVVDRVLRPVGDDDVLRAELVAIRLLVPPDDGGLHLGGAAGGGVVRLPAEGGLLGRLADVFGGVEVRLAETKVVDLHPRRPELTGLGPGG